MNATNTSATKARPAMTLRLNGIKASIWQNTQGNTVFFNTIFERTYRAEDGTFHDTPGFRPSDLPVLEKLANSAFLWIAEERARRGYPDRTADGAEGE